MKAIMNSEIWSAMYQQKLAAIKENRASPLTCKVKWHHWMHRVYVL